MRSLAFALLFAVGPCFAGELPPELVGIWATDNAKMRGYALFEGQAVYLGSDGSGMIIGGPPAIGFKITAEFTVPTNEVEITAHDGKQHAVIGRLRYDPVTKALESLDHSVLHRRFAELTEEMKRGLGLL